MRWTRNDSLAFDAMSRFGQALRDAYDKYEVGQAYKGATQQTERMGLQETNAPDPSAFVYDSDTGQYMPRGGTRDDADSVSFVRPTFEATGTQYGLGLNPQWQDKPFTQEQKDAAGLQAMSAVYAGRGDAEKALDLRSKGSALEAAGLQRALTQHQIARLPFADRLQDLQYEGAITKQKRENHSWERQLVNEGFEDAFKGILAGAPATEVFSKFNSTGAMKVDDGTGDYKPILDKKGQPTGDYLVTGMAGGVPFARKLSDMQRLHLTVKERVAAQQKDEEIAAMTKRLDAYLGRANAANDVAAYTLEQQKKFDVAREGIVADLEAGKITEEVARQRLNMLHMRYGSGGGLQASKPVMSDGMNTKVLEAYNQIDPNDSAALGQFDQKYPGWRTTHLGVQPLRIRGAVASEGLEGTRPKGVQRSAAAAAAIQRYVDTDPEVVAARAAEKAAVRRNDPRRNAYVDQRKLAERDAELRIRPSWEQ